MKDLSDWRTEIDRLDREIVALLNRRAECVLRLAPLKRQANKDVLDPAREAEVLENLRGANAGPLRHEAVARVFKSVMAEMRLLQKGSKVSAE